MVDHVVGLVPGLRVDLHAVDGIPFEGVRDREGVVPDLLDARSSQVDAVVSDQEEPVPAPGHVAGHGAEPVDPEPHAGPLSPAGHVLDRDQTVLPEMGDHRADRGLEPVGTGADPAEMGQGHRHPDRAVDAHVERAHVVEEDHAGGRIGITRFHQQRTDHRLVSARLAGDRSTERVVFVAEDPGPFLDGAVPQVRSALDDDPGGFAFGVTVDDSHIHVETVPDPTRKCPHWVSSGKKERSPMHRSLLASASLAVLGLLVGCGHAVKVGSPVEIRAATNRERDGWERADFQIGGLDTWVAPDATVSGEQILSARRSDLGDGPMIVTLRFDDAGASRMDELSIDRMSRPVVVLLDGRVVAATTLLEPVSDSLTVAFGDTPADTAAADRLVEAVDERSASGASGPKGAESAGGSASN